MHKHRTRRHSTHTIARFSDSKSEDEPELYLLRDINAMCHLMLYELSALIYRGLTVNVSAACDWL